MYKDQIINNLNRIMRYDTLVQELANSSGVQLDDAENLINEFEAQLSIDTATWALVFYEKELGIKTDISKSLDERRARIKFKQIGTGNINANTIKLAALAYPNGDCEVSFNGHIVIKFSSLIGIPDFLESLKSDLEQIKPAHLRIDYEFKYMTYFEFTLLTYDQLHTITYNNFARR
ncbi:putative phage tail protein [Paenibacillus sp. Root444D2]|uniref:putative phage tail protein n=1 Tax=Paenibacillus sp. Root444D2 TaxID=1736538 RepID=UPI000710B6A3|nr:putative phage tail protein [Paenibacillus sp. Root444D2]KQX69221.1 hypothetical protein ASD40_01605 [Paenibacillus sp. Root444D2]